MKIQLQNWKIVNLDLSAHVASKSENIFNLNTGAFFPAENNKTFGINLKVSIKDKEFDLNLESVFMFSLEEEITDDFKLSDFPRINAPAIAFPYIRAFISTITLQSGYRPVILPSINFVQLAKDKN